MKIANQNKGLSSRTVAVSLVLSNLITYVAGVSIAGAMVGRRFDRRSPARRNAVAALDVALLGRAAGQHHSLPISGKGMWIWQFDKAGRGDPGTIVRTATSLGLSHIFVWLGSSRSGAAGYKDLRRILPVAHAAGLKVIAWDFPYLDNVDADLRRATLVLKGPIVGRERIDGFAADVETASEGTHLTRQGARAYAAGLRRYSYGTYLILVPPRPNSYTLAFYPYNVLIPQFDAVAPMVYWGRESAVQATARALAYLGRFGKPVAPIGQAFDMGPEGGPKGAPSDLTVERFMQASESHSAVGVSFWSWQHTPMRLWYTIHSFPWPTGPARS